MAGAGIEQREWTFQLDHDAAIKMQDGEGKQ